MINENNHFQLAIQRFDNENCQDPNIETINGAKLPKELLYAQRMTKWLNRINPEASEPLQLAARSQHICRWTIPRESYPMDRKGYLLWRTELKQFHAEKASEILKECGYDQVTIDRVKSLILKQRIKTDPESQALEDVVCLVFLEYYFEDFMAKHEPEKVVSIVRKTWSKMSESGQQHALALEFGDTSNQLITRAINS
jgi:hypothetical protein